MTITHWSVRLLHDSEKLPPFDNIWLPEKLVLNYDVALLEDNRFLSWNKLFQISSHWLPGNVCVNFYMIPCVSDCMIPCVSDYDPLSVTIGSLVSVTV